MNKILFTNFKTSSFQLSFFPVYIELYSFTLTQTEDTEPQSLYVNGSFNLIPSPSGLIFSFFSFSAECCSGQQKGRPVLLYNCSSFAFFVLNLPLWNWDDLMNLIGLWLYIFYYLFSVTLYTWEHIIMVQHLPLVILKLPHLLIMIYWVQSWEGIYKMRKNQFFCHIFLNFVLEEIDL